MDSNGPAKVKKVKKVGENWKRRFSVRMRAAMANRTHNAKWYVQPEQRSHGARLCIMVRGPKGDIVIATTPGNTSADAFMAEQIVSALLLMEEVVF